MNSLTPPPAAAAPAIAPAPPAIRREFSGGMLTLTFDRPGSSANVLSEAVLRELDSHLAWVGQNSLQGLILISAKPGIFIAGADLKALSAADSGELAALVTLGQEVFNRLSRLPIPKLAAIHGACLGGGLELALACDWRVATDDPATKLGLPEVQLGILPAWGGSSRLPRLVGLPRALQVMLVSKPLSAKQARHLGLVDAVVPAGRLEAAALAFLTRHPVSRSSHFLTNNRLSAAWIRRRVLADLRQKTRGLYPAPEMAVKVAAAGLKLPLEGAQSLERNAIAQLAATPVARNLIRAFLLTERAKKFGSSVVVSAPPITRTAVIGAGVMGAGIAQWLASRGVETRLHDISAERVGAGLKTCAGLFREAVRRGLMTRQEAAAGMDRIVPVSEAGPLTAVDLVIEAATEDLALKRRIFRDLASRVRPDTILATNTSALGIEAISAGVPHPQRVLGMHFFNPVSRMKLVEVATWRDADATAAKRLMRFCCAVGKVPILVHDSPGFVVNRILMPYLLEAGRLFDRGASPADIDEAMLAFGMPMGPLRLLDEVGLDVALHVARTLCEAMPERLQIPAVLTHLVESGHLGVKTGAGFYLHQADYRPNPVALASRSIFGELDAPRQVIRDRLVMLMVNEAAYCVMEGVVQQPEDVDLAMLLGAGFAPLHGGPLRHADAVGLELLVGRLEQTAQATGDPLFAPCPLLLQKAADQGRFLE